MAFALGVLVGLSVALPMGPVGVLLLRSGLVDGVRAAVGAACGVATVDVAYALVAVAVGTPVSQAVAVHASLVRAISAAVLVAVGVVGLVAATRAPTADVGPGRPTSPTRTYRRFVGLTAVNPLTAVTFTAVVLGLASRVDGAGSAAAFVAGVGLASLAWQLLLAVMSGLLGLRLPPNARMGLSVVGSGVVVVLGLALVV